MAIEVGKIYRINRGSIPFCSFDLFANQADKGSGDDADLYDSVFSVTYSSNPNTFMVLGEYKDEFGTTFIKVLYNNKVALTYSEYVIKNIKTFDIELLS